MTGARILASAVVVFAAAAAVQAVRADPHGEPPSRLVSDVGYTLSSRGLVSSLRFTLTPAAPRVRVRVSLRDRWHPCTVAGTRVTCLLGVSAGALRRLQVDA